MRIPGINQTGVPGAEQLSLGAISSAAQAKMRTTQALTKVVGDYQAKVKQAEIQAELHSANIGLERDSQALIQSISEQDAYDKDGKETYPDMMPQFKKGMSSIIKKYNNGLRYPSSKTAYSQSADRYSIQATGKMNSLHRTRQVEHLQGEWTKGLDHYETDLENGLIRAQASTDEKVAGQVISPSQGQNAMDAFRSKWQFNSTVNEFEIERVNGTGEDYLIEFAANPPEGMPEDEQLTLQSRMNTLMSQDRAQAKADLKATVDAEIVRQKSLTKAGQGMAEQLKKGHLVTNDFLTTFTNTANQITDVVVQKELAQALTWSAEVRSVVGVSSMAELNEIRQQAIGTPVDTLEEAEHNEFIADSIKKTMDLIQKDPQSAAVQIGVLKPQINTLQEAIDEGDLQTFVAEMDARKGRLDELWGMDSKLFSNSDADLLAQMINKKDSRFLGGFVTTVGFRSYDVLEQLLGKASSDKVILGTLMAQPDGQEAASTVVKGMKLIKDGIKGFNPKMADMKGSFDKRYMDSGLWPQDDVHFKSGMVANVKYAYASLSADEMDDSGVMDEDRLTQAMDLVMGTPIKMRGAKNTWEVAGSYMMLPPRRGMNKDDTIAWKNSRPESTFDSIDSVLPREDGTTTSAYIKQLIIENQIELTYFGEQGRYYLMWNNKTLKDGKEPYVLEYQD